MDCIIPYKKGMSRELEWAVKSLKNLQVGTVYIIGEKPDYEVDAVFIPEEKISWSNLSPHHNQISKYLTACSISGLSDDVLLTNDDIFCLRPTELKNYNRGYLLDHINERRNDSYRQALINTRKLTMKRGLRELDFEMHVPMVVNKHLLDQAIYELIPYIYKGQSILLRSYYGNRFNIESEYMEDPKNKLPLGTYGSSSNSSFIGEYGEVIREALS